MACQRVLFALVFIITLGESFFSFSLDSFYRLNLCIYLLLQPLWMNCVSYVFCLVIIHSFGADGTFSSSGEISWAEVLFLS